MAVSLQMNSQHICIVCWFWGGVNYQMQNVQTYQLQMIDSRGGGRKLPVVTCAFIK